MNSRFLPIGIAFAPSLPGRPAFRAAQGQAVVDVSLVVAQDGEGGYDRGLLFGSSAIQYTTWVCGTAVGVLAGSVIGDPRTLGLDAIYPAFFLALMFGELQQRARQGRRRGRRADRARARALHAAGRPGAGRLAGDADRLRPPRERSRRGPLSTHDLGADRGLRP